MKLPLSLLKSFLEFDLSLDEIAQTLTELGIEVDGIHPALPPFCGVVVAEIKRCHPHQSADKLQVLEVFDGKDLFQVVCSANNCKVGLKTAFAKPSAQIRDEEGQLHTIAASEIRGVASQGMLASAKDLGLYDDNSGILELPPDWSVGADCLPLLWDPVFEISLTPNLGHCMSALGIARELAAALKKRARLEKPSLVTGKPRSDLQVHIDNPDLCPRYTAQVIENVKIGPSPFWLQTILQMAGYRPINNVVDVTNYILLKYGQPLHAFDYDKIEGKKIRIGINQKPENFEALVGKMVTLQPGNLLIFDAKKPIAIAGVMGGANSSVSESTTTIVLEVAHFDPLTVRASAKKADLRSESSQRFEKGVDPSTVDLFANLATALIIEVTGGSVSTSPIDQKKETLGNRQILCRSQRVNRVLGTQISQCEMKEICERLEFRCIEEEEGAFLWQIPSYRFDLTEEIDLIEEIARIYGYNHIERPLPKASSSQTPHDPVYLFEQELRQRLISLGLQEFITCDLISPKLAHFAAELSLSKESFLHTLHSKSEEYSLLRPSLLPGLFQVIQSNLDHKNHSFAAFEMGRIHLRQKGLPVEFPMVALVLTGKEAPAHFDRKPLDVDFLSLKGTLETLLQALRIKPIFCPSAHPTFHPGRQADVFVNAIHIGTLGELHPNILTRLDIKQRVYYAELNAEYLRKNQAPFPKFHPLPQFPSSERDWTLPIQPNTHVSTIFDSIKAAHIPLLESFELIATYRSEEKANITIRFTYRDPSKTVSFEEVEAAHNHLQQEVLAKTNPPG